MNEPTTLQEMPDNTPQPAVALPPLDPVGHGGPPAARNDGFSGKPQDYLKDMAILAAQQQPTPAVPAVPPTPAPAQPDQPQAAATPVQPAQGVPEKFRNTDGTVNQEALEKSTVNVESALERYRQKEIELRRTQNNVYRLGQGLPVPEVPQAQPQPQQPQSLEELINADFAQNPQNPGRVLAKWAGAIEQSAAHSALGRVSDLQQEVELQKRDREVEIIGKIDPQMLTDQGIEMLTKIRRERPWLNQSPRPWQAAYEAYLGDQQLKQRLGSQVQPNPTRTTAPVAPAVPANRAPSQPVANVGQMTKEQIDAYLIGKSSADVDAFFRSQGLPGFAKGGK